MTTTADPRLVFLTNVRLSYPNIAAPQSITRDDGRIDKVYGASFLLDQGDPQFQKFVGRCTEVLQEAWKEHAQAAIQQIWSNRKSRCFSAGEEHVNAKTMQVREGYAGKLVISASSGEKQPQAINASGAPVAPVAEGAVVPIGTETPLTVFRKLYGGCRVNVALRPWAQMPSAKNKNTSGIRCDLVAIQFARDDTPFGEAAPDVTGLFGVVEAPQGAAAGGFGAPPGIAPPPGLPGFLASPAAAGAVPAAPTFGAPPGIPQMPAFPTSR